MKQTTPSTRGGQLLAHLDPDADADADWSSVELRVDESMARHTTSRLGGPADLWARPDSIDALAQLLARAHALAIPATYVGSGTNLLVRDGGIRGLVVNLGRINGVETVDSDREGNTRIDVQAGCSTGRLLKYVSERGLGGMEFLAGVPGTVGGGLIMNAGTYLGEFVDVVQSVTSVTIDGRLVQRAAEQCGFAYRSSQLPPEEIAVGARLHLSPRDPQASAREVAQLRAHRRAREPKGVYNHGSTFKNPPGDHAGRLIESCGLKGHTVGAAHVSPVHANWLVIDPKSDQPARARDLLELIDHVRSVVEARTGVALVPEVRVIGEDEDSA